MLKDTFIFANKREAGFRPCFFKSIDQL